MTHGWLLLLFAGSHLGHIGRTPCIHVSVSAGVHMTVYVQLYTSCTYAYTVDGFWFVSSHKLNMIAGPHLQPTTPLYYVSQMWAVLLHVTRLHCASVKLCVHEEQAQVTHLQQQQQQANEEEVAELNSQRRQLSSLKQEPISGSSLWLQHTLTTLPRCDTRTCTGQNGLCVALLLHLCP